jgi:UDP-N-acetylmuramoylalanine--D-glutamate ligase
MRDFRNKRVVVAGLGKFGGQIAAARWLVEQGATVLVTDRSPADKLASSVQQLQGLPIEFRLGGHRVEDFTGADLIVTSPAIPPHNEYLSAARHAGVPITTEVRLFIERCPARIVGVTGTKGKSTTTALLGLMLAAKYTTHVGGNIGKPLLPDLPRITRDHVVVLELSSFMLEYLRDLNWSPHVAVVTMLAMDHVDWHGSAEAYLDAKKQILKHQKPQDIAVLPEGMPHTPDLINLTPGRVILFNTHGRPFELRVPGWHNQFNCRAAWAAAQALGVSFDDAQAAVRDFPGLPHRLQLVHESGGVRWFNDSIATIPEAAIAALDSFPKRTVLQIVGGADKGLPFTTLAAALCERAKAALCIGKTGPQIKALIADSPTHGCAPVYECGDLKTAVAMARKIAVPGDVVLLSTGCASYDQFGNFEERGNQFAELARQPT